MASHNHHAAVSKSWLGESLMLICIHLSMGWVVHQSSTQQVQKRGDHRVLPGKVNNGLGMYLLQQERGDSSRNVKSTQSALLSELLLLVRTAILQPTDKDGV